MSNTVPYLRSEALTLGLVLAAACLLSSGSLRRSRWFSWLIGSRRSINNIYQLIPILQKNARVLFIIFNDFASAINSATGSPDGGSRPSKDDIRALLNQDWVQEKLRRAQDSVLQEFKVDADALAEALTRFHNDDQVRMYTNGVELMYNIVLDGGYPQCPGMDICEAVTKEVALSILGKVVEAKRKSLKDGVTIYESTDRVEIEVVFREMQRFGYSDIFDSFVTFKNTENCYQYDYDFMQAKRMLYMDPAQRIISIIPGSSIQRVSAEELRTILKAMDADTPLILLLFELDSVIPGFVSHVRRLTQSEPKTLFLWMFRGDMAPEYECSSYPAAIRFRGNTVEDIIYQESLSSVH